MARVVQEAGRGCQLQQAGQDAGGSAAGPGAVLGSWGAL